MFECQKASERESKRLEVNCVAGFGGRLYSYIYIYSCIDIYIYVLLLQSTNQLKEPIETEVDVFFGTAGIVIIAIEKDDLI